ncbi:MAG: pilin [bacterium]|nr:pilin [bacterium]
MKRYFFSSILFLTFVVLPGVALALDPPAGGQVLPAPGGGQALPPPGGGQVPQGQSQYTVLNPLGADSFCGLVKNILQAAIQIGIPVAVLFIVYAGFKFVLARGKPEELKKARDNFLWTIIGIAIFLGAWLLASVIKNTVNQLGGNQNIISCN